MKAARNIRRVTVRTLPEPQVTGRSVTRNLADRDLDQMLIENSEAPGVVFGPDWNVSKVAPASPDLLRWERQYLDAPEPRFNFWASLRSFVSAFLTPAQSTIAITRNHVI